MARQFQASEVLSECLQPPPPPPPTYALNTAVRLQGVAGHQSAPGRHSIFIMIFPALHSPEKNIICFCFLIVYEGGQRPAGSNLMLSKILPNK